jgi:hypothetical protein
VQIRCLHRLQHWYIGWVTENCYKVLKQSIKSVVSAISVCFWKLRSINWDEIIWSILSLVRRTVWSEMLRKLSTEAPRLTTAFHFDEHVVGRRCRTLVHRLPTSKLMKRKHGSDTVLYTTS